MTRPSLLAVDTSVAVPLVVASHEAHAEVSAWAAGRTLVLSGHALSETYAVLTRLPGDARVTVDDAVLLIDDNFEAPLVIPPARAAQLHREFAGLGIAGGATYDALVAVAAKEAGVLLATRDARARSTYEAVGVEVVLVPTS